MADDVNGPEPPTEPELGGGRRPSWLQANRGPALILGCIALCGLIGLDVYVMLRNDQKRGATPAAPSASPAANLPTPSSSTRTMEAAPSEPVEEALDYESDDGEPRPSKPAAAPKRMDTVQQAAIESCTTASVDGLSRQIIAQARCFKPNAFVPLPSRPNLVIASQVFPYLELEARDRLLKALDANPKAKMTVNSALRTVAQQYLVWRWSATKRCGVPMATPPGESNHETGTALDIAEAAGWRQALEAQNFRWLGPSDRVHFDYRGGAPASRTAIDVLAFQKLWNRNNPDDKVAEDGRYSPATEQRLKQAPADGFKLGPSCAKPGK